MALFVITLSTVSASNVSDISDDLSISDSSNLVSSVAGSDSDVSGVSSSSDGSGVSSSSDASGALLGSSSDGSGAITDSSSSQTDSSSSNSSDNSSNSEVVKNSTSIVVSSKTVVRGNTLNITLKDKDSNAPLANKTVTFTFNDKQYNKTTNNKGIATLTLSATPKKYLVKIKFAGDDDYQKSSKSVNITLTKTPTSFSSSGSSIVRGKAYKITLKDAKGNPLSSKKISLTFNGKTYSKTTSSNGQASLTINGNFGKTYKLTYKFAGDTNYAASSGSVSIKVKKGTSISGSGSSVVQGNSYKVTLKDVNGVALSSKTVVFTFGGKQYNRTTDSKGQASLKIKVAPNKSYNLSYKYGGSSYHGPSSGSVSLFVKTPTSFKNSGSSIISGKVYKVTLKDSNGKALANKKIVMSFDNKNYNKTTNDKGQASLTIKGTFGRAYPLSYKFAGDGKYGPSSGSLSLRVKKGTTITGSGNGIVQGNSYKITLKDSNGTILSSQKVTFTFIGKQYNRTTDSKGQASLKISAAAGNAYAMSYKYGGTSYYNASSSGNFDLKVKFKTTLSNSGKSVMNGTNYKITLKDSKSNPLSNRTIAIGFNGKTYNKTTDDNGVASLKINANTPKSYNLTYKFAGDSYHDKSSGSLSVNVKFNNTFTIAQVISASSTLKSYVVKNKEVPATVSVNGVSLNLTSFTYLMAKAVVSINSNKTSGNLALIAIDSNYSNNGSMISDNLYKANYIDLSNKLIKYADSNHAVPNSIDTKIGLISHDLYSFGLAKALVFYSTDKYLPNYLILNSGDVSESRSANGTNYTNVTTKGNSSQFKAGLNEIENLTSSQVASYLSSSGNDALNSAIISLSNQLVAGKTSLWAKATAIYNYVRDNISYSYYADSQKGAGGTLSAKAGNCCDQANLVVALCRAANITARFSHAQGCTFSSGLVTGHVWAQIYIDGVWYTADATSRRNSLGNIINWNTNHYNTLKKYAHLSF